MDVFMELKAALDAETIEAECKLDSARRDEIKVDEVLEFCERMLCNVPMFWSECSLDRKQIPASCSPGGVYKRKTGCRTQATEFFLTGARVPCSVCGARQVYRPSEVFIGSLPQVWKGQALR
jgi:hypothetical protein